ncbi:MAG TPA: IPT/TIG domain-containing protein [Bryobacteraceae bacterium]
MVSENFSRARVIGFGLALTLASALSAAPRLNLDQTALIVSTAQGSNGPAQTVLAKNIGDGSLSLNTSASVSWLVPAIGKAQSCGITGGSCIPVQIALQSSSLAKGTYTGTITVSDPNAIDAPQFITVTLSVGGPAPDKLEFYVAPGSSASTNITTYRQANASVDNAPWLSVASNGAGSFAFNVSYKVTATASSGMAVNDYNGSLTLSGSSFAPDNKQIPVVLHVTTQPVLSASPGSVQIRIAQGASKESSTTGALPYISTANTGQGSLTISNVSATSSGGTWLGASTVSGFPSLVAITADPSGLTPNVYTGTITIASNAANSSVQIPVQLIVEEQGPPFAAAGGVVNNGTFAGNESLAQGDITAVFGDQFTYGDPQSASTLPLGTSLGNTQVLVNGTAAPVYYVSPTQINFQIPFEAATGDGTIQVVRNGQPGNKISVNISASAPRFITLGNGYVIMTTPEGALTGIPSHPVKAGDVAVIYVIGLGPTSPSVPSGTASPTPPAVVPATQVCFGQHSAVVQPLCTSAFFAGLTPGLVGLYQINVTIPEGVPVSNNTPLYFTVGGQASDQELIAVQ